jgi:hypothetical protein
MSSFENDFEKAMTAAASTSQAPSKKKGIGPGTVSNFLLVLGSKITQQDQREALAAIKRRSPVNIYALGLLFKAADKVKERVKGLEESSDAASLSTLRAAMNREFNPGYPPVKNVEKQIQAWLTSGKQPSLVG